MLNKLEINLSKMKKELEAVMQKNVRFGVLHRGFNYSVNTVENLGKLATFQTLLEFLHLYNWNKMPFSD